MKKKYLSTLALLSLAGMALVSCGDTTPGKTKELEPDTATKAESKQALSTLGKAMKAQVSKEGVSLLATSTKDLAISAVKKTHNAVENTDSEEKFSLVASGLSSDTRYAIEKADVGDAHDKLSFSTSLSGTNVHWDYESGETRSARTRSGVKFNAQFHDDTFYVDPSNASFSSLIVDFADLAGFGDYRTIITSTLSQKYKLSVNDLAELIGTETDVSAWQDEVVSFLSEEKIDEFIVEVDKHLADYASWLSAYSNEDKYTFYGSLSKEELIAFLETTYTPEEEDEKINFTEELAGLTLRSFEFVITFSEVGLEDAKILFDASYSKDGIDAYDVKNLNLGEAGDVPTPSKIGTSSINLDLSGGFALTFGNEIPEVKEDKGYTDIAELIESMMKTFAD